MPKRKQKKRRKNHRQNKTPSEDDSGDNVSEKSSIMSFAQEVDPGFTSQYMGDMEGCLEPLTEKRSMSGGAERSKAYVVMTSLLSKAVWREWCVRNAHVLKQVFTDSLKRGDNSERINALQSCCRTIITLGDDIPSTFTTAVSEGILLAIRTQISELRLDFEGAKTWGASSSGEVDPVDLDPEEENKASRMVGLAMNVLPLLGFASGEAKSRKQIANLLFDVWADSGYYPSVRAGALEGWVIAVANMTIREKGSLLFTKAIPLLVEIIEEEPSPEMAELFTAAGSAVALLYEAHFAMQYQDPGGVDDDDEETTSWKYDHGEIVDTEYIKSLLEGMSTQSSKGQKRDKMKAQRRNFRQFASALDENCNSPSVNIKLKKQELRLVGWTSTICWDYMKRNLAGGLQAHLLGNSWLQNVFGIDGTSLQFSVAKSKQDKVDQVAERRTNSKEQYLKLRKARGRKYFVHNEAY